MVALNPPTIPFLSQNFPARNVLRPLDILSATGVWEVSPIGPRMRIPTCARARIYTIILPTSLNIQIKEKKEEVRKAAGRGNILDPGRIA